jgi:hypothetical protein
MLGKKGFHFKIFLNERMVGIGLLSDTFNFSDEWWGKKVSILRFEK